MPDLTMREIGRKGGHATFKRYGAEHYREMSQRGLSTKPAWHDGLLHLQAAAEAYHIPSATIRLWSVQALTRYKFDGDRRVYVSAKELERFLARRSERSRSISEARRKRR